MTITYNPPVAFKGHSFCGSCGLPINPIPAALEKETMYGGGSGGGAVEVKPQPIPSLAQPSWQEINAQAAPWSEALEYEIIEDYISEAEMSHGLRNGRDAAYYDRMRGYFEKLKSFIANEIAKAEKRGEQKGYEEGFVNGQTHSFGVDRERVKQEGRNALVEELRGIISKYGIQQ